MPRENEMMTGDAPRGESALGGARGPFYREDMPRRPTTLARAMWFFPQHLLEGSFAVLAHCPRDGELFFESSEE